MLMYKPFLLFHTTSSTSVCFVGSSATTIDSGSFSLVSGSTSSGPCCSSSVVSSFDSSSSFSSSFALIFSSKGGRAAFNNLAILKYYWKVNY